MTVRTITLSDGRVVKVDTYRDFNAGGRWVAEKPIFGMRWPIAARGPTEADAIDALRQKLEDTANG